MTPSKTTVPPCICGRPRCKIPLGTCHCGCGGLTKPTWKNGKPRKFILGHQRKKTPRPVDEAPFYIEGEPCRKVPIKRGVFAIVDERNYSEVMRHKWTQAKGRHTSYAYRSFNDENGRRVAISMHRQILRLTDRKIEGDHRNGNGLDNRESNLRPATATQQRQNMKLNIRNTTGHAGVQTRGGRFRARIRDNGREVWLGTYKTIEEAAAARRAAETHFHGKWPQQRKMVA